MKWLIIIKTILLILTQIHTTNTARQKATKTRINQENGNGANIKTIALEYRTRNNGTLTNHHIITEYGQVLGHLENNFWAFYDIPYGKINGIFQAPLKPDVWSETHDKTIHDSQCPQLSDDEALLGDTDCLTLSIFTPVKITEPAGVLFHIHDGNYVKGSGDPMQYRPKNIVSKEVIVVLPNYRLGPLGFLCLRDEVAPGNAALKDLTLALEWIVNNIKNFGGNPNNIAVSGEGSAGALAGLLALSEQSKPFVTKVITESGSFLSHLALDRDPNTAATILFQRLSKSNETINTEVIKNATLLELTLASKNITFKPCVENGKDGFLTKSPWKMLSEGAINIDFMLGSASMAGYDKAIETMNHFATDQDWDSILPEDLSFPNGENEKHEIANKVKTLYTNGINVTDILDKEVQYLLPYQTDVSYLGPDIRSARALIKAGAKVYIYEFSYKGKFNSEESPRVIFSGAYKGDFISYVLPRDDLIEDGDVYEEIVDTLTNLWANFISTGIPFTEDVTWSKFETADESKEVWLSIGMDIAERQGFHVDRLALWTDLYNQYYVDRSYGISNCQSPFYWMLSVCFVIIFMS